MKDNSTANQICVYTTNIGSYEPLMPQNVAANSNIPFICLSDDPDSVSESWRIHPIKPILPSDPTRSQRFLKIYPPAIVTKYRYQIYIDSVYELKIDPTKLIDAFPPTNGISLFIHEFRDTVLDEFIAVAEGELDDTSRIYEQLNHYVMKSPEILLQKPYHSALIIFDSEFSYLEEFRRIWAAHVLRYSRRDQLSLNFALKYCGISASTYDCDLYKSKFVEYKRLNHINRNQGIRDIKVSLSPAILTEYMLKKSVYYELLNKTLIAKRTKTSSKYKYRDLMLRFQLARDIRLLIMRRAPKIYNLTKRRT